MVNLAIIGCGHWGSNHIRVFNSFANAKVIACCDKDKNRLNRIAGSYPGLKVTSDYETILRDGLIDAVVIATPTASHYRIVKAALSAGKHVFSEKPLCLTSAESGELVLLGQKKRRVLMVGYVFLFNNGILALKECVKAKELGRLHYLHLTRTNLGPIRDDVDVVYDLASHDIAIASFLLNKWPERVSVNAGRFLRKNISDIAFITLYYPSNILVHIHVSWLDPKKVRQAICVGDKKMAIWDDLDAAEPIRLFNKGVIKEPFYSDYGEFQLLPREGEVVSPLIKLSEPLRNQNSYFIECISNNKKPLTNAVFAHNITKVLEAIGESMADNGRIQKISKTGK